jgi:hypothetical protein
MQVGLIMFHFIKKYFFLQEKNSIYTLVTDNIWVCNLVKWDVWKNPERISDRTGVFYRHNDLVKYQVKKRRPVKQSI